MWQLCPKCNGTGQVLTPYYGNFSSVICDVCSGSKLISMLTGRPPYEVKITTSSTTEINKP